MGFNGARKHQKFEDPYFYYYAEELGFLTWCEMPSAYNFCMDEMDALEGEWYEIVRAAHDAAAAAVRPEMMYTEYSDAAFRTIIEGLKALDIVRGSVDDALEAGAGYLFMPHGLGHGIGLDVHDCENIGERSFSFADFEERAKISACCITRPYWRLRKGTVLSDEPGIYFVPALIDKYRAEGKCKGIVNYEKLESYRDFGGIRLEDDLIVTDTGAKIVGDRTIPITVEDVEAIVGRD